MTSTENHCMISPICELEDGHSWDSVVATGKPVRWHARTFGNVEISQEETVSDDGSHVLSPPAVFVGEVLECLSADEAAALGVGLEAASDWLTAANMLSDLDSYSKMLTAREAAVQPTDEQLDSTHENASTCPLDTPWCVDHEPHAGMHDFDSCSQLIGVVPLESGRGLRAVDDDQPAAVYIREARTGSDMDWTKIELELETDTSGLVGITWLTPDEAAAIGTMLILASERVRS